MPGYNNQYYVPIRGFASSESTRTKLTPNNDLSQDELDRIKSSQTSVKAVQKKQAEDKAVRIAKSEAAYQKRIKTGIQSSQDMADETGAIGDKISLQNLPVIGKYVPGLFDATGIIGNMASGLGRIPLNLENKQYGQAALSVGIPLTTGAIAGLGNPSTPQFINNIVNPLSGIVDQVGNKYFPSAYKLNPWAFKPQEGMMYRGIGREGMEDAFNSGVFRAKQEVQPVYYRDLPFDFSKKFSKTYWTPKFSTADDYANGFIAEVPNSSANFRLRYPGKEWSQIADREIPVSEGRILEANWLKRYKDITKEFGGIIMEDNKAKYGIHINPKNKGKFNALKKRTGKTTEELTHSKNPLTRKRAIFAQNAAKWKHENGGYATSDNIDMGYYTNPVKYFAAMGINISDDDCLECGGRIKANKGVNVPEKQIPTSEQVKAWNKAKYELKLQLEKEGKDISYLDHNLDYAKSFLQTYNKQNNFIFGKEKSPEEIVKYWQEYNNDVYSDPTYKNSLLPFNNAYQKSVENNVRNDSINENNRSDPDGVLGSFTINDTTPFRILQKKGTDESGEAVIILNPYSPEKFTIEKNSIIKKNTPVSNEQLLQELYNVPNYGVTSSHIPNSNNSPAPSFQNGGLVRAWIQKFMKGGYIAEGGYPNAQELTQPTTNYYNWGNYGNQNSFLTPDQINQKPFENPYQNMNLQQPNVPQFNIPKGQEIEPLTSIGAQKMTPDLQGIRNRANQSMQDIAPKSKSPMNMNAVNMGLDIGTQSMSAAANLMGSLGKDNSKAQAFGQGASGAMNVASQVTAPFKDIPIAGKAIDAVGKTLGFFIGGALGARRQGIENEEMNKYNKVQEYTSRNMQTIQQPSYYGQYMSKYGSNIKNLEKRLMDDIFSDFDKYMKLT